MQHGAAAIQQHQLHIELSKCLLNLDANVCLNGWILQNELRRVLLIPHVPETYLISPCGTKSTISAPAFNVCFRRPKRKSMSAFLSMSSDLAECKVPVSFDPPLFLWELDCKPGVPDSAIWGEIVSLDNVQLAGTPRVGNGISLTVQIRLCVYQYLHRLHIVLHTKHNPALNSVGTFF